MILNSKVYPTQYFNTQLLNHSQVENGHISTDGVLRDYCDGTEYVKHPLASLDPQFLQLFLYYDDLEVCNPIGSKCIIHKLGKV